MIGGTYICNVCLGGEVCRFEMLSEVTGDNMMSRLPVGGGIFECQRLQLLTSRYLIFYKLMMYLLIRFYF